MLRQPGARQIKRTDASLTPSPTRARRLSAWRIDGFPPAAQSFRYGARLLELSDCTEYLANQNGGLTLCAERRHAVDLVIWASQFSRRNSAHSRGYPHWVSVKQVKVGLLSVSRKWVIEDGGVFHLCSWELQEIGHWQRLDDVLLFMRNEVSALTNGQICQLSLSGARQSISIVDINWDTINGNQIALTIDGP